MYGLLALLLIAVRESLSLTMFWYVTIILIASILFWVCAFLLERVRKRSAEESIGAPEDVDRS